MIEGTGGGRGVTGEGGLHTSLASRQWRESVCAPTSLSSSQSLQRNTTIIAAKGKSQLSTDELFGIKRDSDFAEIRFSNRGFEAAECLSDRGRL